MDRLARSLVDLHTLVDELSTHGITVTFLQEGQSYSANPSTTGKLLLGMLGAVAEFERSIIRERQAEGIARAKARGVYKGRKPVPGEKIEQAKKLVSQGVPKARVARDLGVMSRDVVESVEGYAANRRVVSVVVVEVEPAGQRQASFGL